MKRLRRAELVVDLAALTTRFRGVRLRNEHNDRAAFLTMVLQSRTKTSVAKTKHLANCALRNLALLFGDHVGN